MQIPGDLLFIWDIFGFPKKAVCPLNINHPSVLVISTGVIFYDIEPLCVAQMYWLCTSSLRNYRMGCLIVGVRRIWDLPQNLTTILLLREYHSLSASLGSLLMLPVWHSVKGQDDPASPEYLITYLVLILYSTPHVIAGHSKVDFPWIWFK